MTSIVPSVGRGFKEPIIRQAIIDQYTKIGMDVQHVVEDKTQCFVAIGDVDCQWTYCYLCGARISVRPSEICCDSTSSQKLTTKNTSYPQCEHIIPCETKILNMNPYLRMIMITTTTQKLIKDESPEYKEELTTDRLNELLQEYIKIKDNKGKKLFFILNIMLRLNYSWAHAYCNNLKGNKNFINFDSKKNLFFIDKYVIDDYLKALFANGKWDEKVRNELIKFLINDQHIYPDTYGQLEDGKKSIIEKLTLIISILNNPDYKIYRNVSQSTLSKGGNKKSKLLLKKKGGVLINFIKNREKEELNKNLIKILDNILKSDEIRNLINLIKYETPINEMSLTGGAIKCKKEHIYIKKLKKIIKNLEEKFKNLKLKKGGGKRKHMEVKEKVEGKVEVEEEVEGKVEVEEEVEGKDTYNKKLKDIIKENNSTEYTDGIDILKYMLDNDSISFKEYLNSLNYFKELKKHTKFQDYLFFNRTCDLFLMLNIVFNILSNNASADADADADAKAKAQDNEYNLIKKIKKEQILKKEFYNIVKLKLKIRNKVNMLRKQNEEELSSFDKDKKDDEKYLEENTEYDDGIEIYNDDDVDVGNNYDNIYQLTLDDYIALRLSSATYDELNKNLKKKGFNKSDMILISKSIPFTEKILNRLLNRLQYIKRRKTKLSPL